MLNQSVAEVLPPAPSRIAGGADLQAAFDLFSQVSTQLSDSYRALEERVQELSVERDDADRQRLRELEEKEQISERLQSLLDLLPGGVVVLDSHGKVCDSNPAADELLGQDLRGKRWLDVITACLAPRHDDGHEVSLRDGRRLSLATRSLQGGCGQVVLLTDQTDTRRLQEQLARQERLTLMGRMLAALAHQIRTPLAAAMLYAGHLAGERLDAKQTRRFAEKTLSRLQAMEYQVRDMLIFVKGDVPLTARVSVPDLVEALRSAMEPALINYTGSCDWQVDTNPELQLQCNRDALVGAVMNLVTNGIQAMAGSGRLELRLCQADDLRLVITVADDGPGMDQSTLEKVNDVFFSTKPHGTGLGLAVVRAVAQAHQGEFTLRSAPGEGCQATISLPIFAAGSKELSND